jgi:hypothetical protein
MARLIHVPTQLVVPRPRRAAPRGDDPAARVSRPSGAGVLDPWFELTPFAPSVDSRVTPGVGVGVMAQLRTYGGVTAPGLGTSDAGPREVVLGGNTAPLHAAAPSSDDELRRQCTVSLRLFASGLASGRQCLLIYALRGRDSQERASVQVLVEHHPIEATTIVGDDRLPLLIELHDGGDLDTSLWLRLCGDGARLGVVGVAGFLL